MVQCERPRRDIGLAGRGLDRAQVWDEWIVGIARPIGASSVLRVVVKHGPQRGRGQVVGCVAVLPRQVSAQRASRILWKRLPDPPRGGVDRWVDAAVEGARANTKAVRGIAKQPLAGPDREGRTGHARGVKLNHHARASIIAAGVGAVGECRVLDAIARDLGAQRLGSRWRGRWDDKQQQGQNQCCDNRVREWLHACTGRSGFSGAAISSEPFT